MIILPDFPHGNSKDLELHKYVVKLVGTELSNLDIPCYYPKFIKYWKELQYKTSLDNKTLKASLDSLDKKYKSFRLLNDAQTMLMLIAVSHFLRNNKPETAKLFYLLLALRMYSNLEHRYIKKFCIEEIWKSALNQLSQKHLFKEKGGIAGAIHYLSDIEFDKFKSYLKSDKLDDDIYQKMVFSLRHRINQSIKSFFVIYHDLYNKKEKGISSKEEIDSRVDIQFIAEKITETMCTFSQIDSVSLNKAISLSGIRKELGKIVISELSTVSYKSDIRFIIILIGRLTDIKNVCYPNKRNLILRKIDDNAQIGNYVIKTVILDMLYKLDIGPRLKTLPESQLIVFFVNYLTLFIQHRICV